jgi:hypothetical protein
LEKTEKVLMKDRILISVLIALVTFPNAFCGDGKSLASDKNSVDSIKLTAKSSSKVYKIDSINNYYLIYIVKDKKQYKVVSEKTAQTGCKMIRIGKSYDLKLVHYFEDIAGGVFKPNCVRLADKTEICLEDSIADMCISQSLRGLCEDNASEVDK